MARSFVQFSLDERRTLFHLHHNKIPVAEIARIMGRHRSTIYREIKRNWWHDTEVPQADGYWHMSAHGLATDRRARHRKLVRHDDLRAAVIDRLKDGWSPEQIAGRLRIEPNMSHRICHETIYQYIYSEDGQSEELARYLPERRRQRKPRYARKARNHAFPDSVSIQNRPDYVNDREQFGHWEGDLMIFRREHGQANIATVVERKSRYTHLLQNNDRKSWPIMNQLIETMSPLPLSARQSITFDRVFEFVGWRELHKGMGTKSWFCDPQAPWQKGTVENTNRRVRRHLPRSVSLLSLPAGAVNAVCERLNATPRKCLGYRTPAEVFREHVFARKRIP